MTDSALEDLIAKAQLGDHHAFRQLVERYQGLVYSIAFRLTRDVAEAEDITQEVFVRLWKNLTHYNPQFSMKAWVGKMTTNLALDYLRSAKKKQTLQPPEAASHIQSPVWADEAVHAKELHDLVLKLSAHLPPKQRAIFVLRDVEQCSVDDVAHILAMHADNIKSNLCHARSTMKSLLKKFLC